MIKLTKRQQEIVDNPARVKLVMGGHRSGKTTLAISNLWQNMKRENRESYKAVYLVDRVKILGMIFRELKRQIPQEYIKETIGENGVYFVIVTTIGEIHLTTQPLDFPFDSITIDNATSNRYVNEKLLDNKVNTFIAGHFPEDMSNLFFRLWLYAYFAELPNIAAFRISSWENPSMNNLKNKYGKDIQEKFGKARYDRDYLCIPNYLDIMPEKCRKIDYIGTTIDSVKNNEIRLQLQGSYFIGFDKAKE